MKRYAYQIRSVQKIGKHRYDAYHFNVFELLTMDKTSAETLAKHLNKSTFNESKKLGVKYRAVKYHSATFQKGEKP